MPDDWQCMDPEDVGKIIRHYLKQVNAMVIDKSL
jgi:hypothetical protein